MVEKRAEDIKNTKDIAGKNIDEGTGKDGIQDTTSLIIKLLEMVKKFLDKFQEKFMNSGYAGEKGLMYAFVVALGSVIYENRKTIVPTLVNLVKGKMAKGQKEEKEEKKDLEEIPNEKDETKPVFENDLGNSAPSISDAKNDEQGVQKTNEAPDGSDEELQSDANKAVAHSQNKPTKDGQAIDSDNAQNKQSHKENDIQKGNVVSNLALDQLEQHQQLDLHTRL